MSRDSPNSLSIGQSEKSYHEVVQGLEKWMNSPRSRTETNVKNSIHQAIKSHLHQCGHSGLANQVALTRYASGCDINIGDQIGIAIIYDLPKRTTDWIHQRLRVLFKSYSYIIIYGHRIRQEKTDAWRHVKRSTISYSKNSNGNRTRSVKVLQTMELIEYRIPMTGIDISKTILKKLALNAIWITFTVGGGLLLTLTEGSDIMSQAYISAILVFNIIVVIFLIFITRI